MSGSDPLERLPIASIQKNAREKLEVELRRMSARRWSFSTRVWYSEGDAMLPGRGGFTLPVELLPELASAIEAAIQESRDRGILE